MRSPKFVPPAGMEGKALAGVRPCGCVTAALSMGGPEEWSRATEKEVRDFYADMARSGREVRWMDADELRPSLTMACPHRATVTVCSCGVVTGGHRDPNPLCPVHGGVR